jgi:plasmid stabilization system protein ParE
MTDEGVRWTNNYLTDVEAMIDYLASVRTPTKHRNLVSRALTGLRGVVQREDRASSGNIARWRGLSAP